jgi:hypothetical protein
MHHTKIIPPCLILSVLFCSCLHSQHKQFYCRDLHDGEFLFQPRFGTTYSIVRSGDSQTETDMTTGSVHKEKVMWKSDCEYTLYRVLDDSLLHNSTDSFFSQKGINIAITGITDSSYMFMVRVDSAGKSMDISDTMKIIRRGPQLLPVAPH